MKRPKAPPRAKPITPDTAVLPGQDSMTADIYQEIAQLAKSSPLKEGRGERDMVKSGEGRCKGI